MPKIKSPYTASITGGGFLYEETLRLLPLLQSEDREALLKDEKLHNRVLQINAETSRIRIIVEISRRFAVMPNSFWTDFLAMSPADQQVALFLVILKTYKILFDFHIEVTLRKWKSIDKTVGPDDLMLEFNEVAARDPFVDSWKEATRKKITSSYLTILRKIGLIDSDNNLQPLHCSNFDYYLTHRESWFLEACLLQPYEIDNIKNSLS